GGENSRRQLERFVGDLVAGSRVLVHDVGNILQRRDQHLRCLRVLRDPGGACTAICVPCGFLAIAPARRAVTISQPSPPVISFQPCAPLKMTRQSGFCLAVMLASGSISIASATRPASSCARATAKFAFTVMISLPRSMPLALA